MLTPDCRKCTINFVCLTSRVGYVGTRMHTSLSVPDLVPVPAGAGRIVAGSAGWEKVAGGCSGGRAFLGSVGGLGEDSAQGSMGVAAAHALP